MRFRGVLFSLLSFAFVECSNPNIFFLKVSLTGSALPALNACTLYTVTLVDSNLHRVIRGTGTQTVTLSGLGSGAAYSSLVNCTNSVTTTTLTLPQQVGSVSFYYRNSVIEALTLTAVTNGSTGVLSIGSTSFQVLGQTSTGTNRNLVYGQSNPLSVCSVGSQVFVADTTNNRVLVFNSLPTSSGQSANFALGQPDLFSILANNGGLSASTLNQPRGVFSDGVRLFVADTGNHRVLVWNAIPTVSGQAANFALGQPDLISNTANNGGLSASTLSSPSAAFSNGVSLFVSDTGNHRVLGWTLLPTVDGQAANFALGQPDLISNTANNGGLSASTLDSPVGVHSDGTNLFVADTNNHRTLIWNVLPSTDGQAADLALGQPDLISNVANNGGLSGSTMSGPLGVYGNGTALFVADGGNNRVLAWNSVPTLSGQVADFGLGQPDLISNTANNGGLSTGMTGLGALSINGARLFATDSSNNRVLIWSALPTTQNQASTYALGQQNMTSNTANEGGVTSVSLRLSNNAFGDGTRLFIADTSRNRVLVWNSMPTSNGQAADLVLGQPNLTSATSNNGGLSGATMNGPESAYSDGTRLFVADTGNHRVLVWNTIPTTSGQAANFALGQPNLISNTANNGGLSASTLNGPYSIYENGTRLFVADTSNHRVLVWNALPILSGQAANFALGQPDLISNTANNGGLSASTLSSPYSVFSSGVRVVVADGGNHRVLAWTALPTLSGTAANFALGQPDLISNTVNNGGLSASTLSGPTGVHSDGTRLLVADTANNRVLDWSAFPVGSGQAANFVLGQPGFVSNTANNGGLSATSLNGPTGVYSDGTRVFIGDLGNSRVLVMPAP